LKTGQKLAELRARDKLTQEQLSEKLFVSRDLVSKWETGKRRPNNLMIRKLAEIFGVEESALTEENRSVFTELSECIPNGFNTGNETLTNILNSFLQTLSERDRAVFVRRYYSSETAAEIGCRYGLNQAYVRTLLMRLRKKLKKYLKEVL